MQLAAAVVVGSWRDVRTHRLLALRAVATGLVTLSAYFTVVAAIARVVRVLSNGGYYVGGHWLTLPPRPLPPPPYDVFAMLSINALGFGLSGWAVVRSHRAHGVAMAMPFLAIIMLMALIPLTIVVTDTGPGTRSMPVLEMVWIFGTMFLSIPGGILLGGYSATRPVDVA